jgi:methionyl aminopeptidase
VIKTGTNIYEMCSAVEEAVRRLSGYQPITPGLASPCGCSLNNCAPRYPPNRNNRRVLQAEDVVKIDIGININGNVVDSALTVCFGDKFTPQLEAPRRPTNVGLRTGGIDICLSDIGSAIQEVFNVESIDIKGKHCDIKTVANLRGHLLRRYMIQASKSIPLVGGRNIWNDGKGTSARPG